MAQGHKSAMAAKALSDTKKTACRQEKGMLRDYKYYNFIQKKLISLDISQYLQYNLWFIDILLVILQHNKRLYFT